MSLSFSLGKCWKFSEHFKKHFPTRKAHGFNFRCRANGQRVIPSGQDSSILPARVANHNAGFDSSLPSHRASHIIIPRYCTNIYMCSFDFVEITQNIIMPSILRKSLIHDLLSPSQSWCCSIT